MYDIQFTKSAQREFDNLPLDIQERISAALDRSRIRPHSYFERLVGDKSYKLRVGNYRVIADIFHDKLLILIIKTGHRKNIYKN
ncbi:type II toxin-antitoxin system RelE/ParE family toxin [Candidatus Pacearchaeota archaeon]|nr:type II toxin-antitoxin system RelE/ParE family toxin [Candidatus Pacearchaeota archaeon]